MNRNDFLRQSLLASAGSLLVGTGSTAFRPTHRIDELCLIVNLIRKELRQDWKGTMSQVAAIGYKGLEFNNDYFPGVDQKEIRDFLIEKGMRPLISGTTIGEMANLDAFSRTIEEALYMGKEYVTCYWPWHTDGENLGPDDFKKAAEELNRGGEICKKRGIRFAFHNHEKEFVPVQGYASGYDMLLSLTDPHLVVAQMDLYWAIRGGADPVRLFGDFPGRFPLLHVKDMERGPLRRITCPGYGRIDFANCFAHAGTAGVKHYIVEVDEADRHMQCLTDSYRYLMGLRF